MNTNFSPSIEKDLDIHSYALGATRFVNSGLYLKIETVSKVKKVALAIPIAALDGLLSVLGRTLATIELTGNGFRILFKSLIKNEEGFFVKTALLHFQAALEMIGSLAATVLLLPVRITYQAGALMFQSTKVDQFDRNNLSAYFLKNQTSLTGTTLLSSMFGSDEEKKKNVQKMLKDIFVSLSKV
jgi:hypothetical protein